MEERRTAALDLYWIPLGAGGHSVRFNGKIFEALQAARERRPRRDLYHAALSSTSAATATRSSLRRRPTADESSRGVVVTGAVGSRLWAGSACSATRFAAVAVGRSRTSTTRSVARARLSEDPAAVRRLLDLVSEVPALVWGRDEVGAGEMWNSNSVIAWLIARAGLPVGGLAPPACGRAPGWSSGVALAARGDASHAALPVPASAGAG